MNEPFLKPIARNGFYLMSFDSFNQLDTGRVVIKKNDYQYETVTSRNHYNGGFLRALDEAGLTAKKLKTHYLITKRIPFI